MLIGVGFGRVIGFVWKFKKICSKYWLSLSPPESWRTWLTSILFFMCSGRCSLEGPLERCAGSSGGGGEKCPPLSPSLLEPGESYPLVGGGRRRVVAWPPCISIIHLQCHTVNMMTRGSDTVSQQDNKREPHSQHDGKREAHSQHDGKRESHSQRDGKRIRESVLSGVAITIDSWALDSP